MYEIPRDSLTNRKFSWFLIVINSFIKNAKRFNHNASTKLRNEKVQYSIIKSSEINLFLFICMIRVCVLSNNCLSACCTQINNEIYLMNIYIHQAYEPFFVWSHIILIDFFSFFLLLLL